MRRTVLLLLLLAAAAVAEPDHGLYVSATGGLQRLDGTGTWGGTPFDAGDPVPVEEGEPLGLAWTDHVLFGVTPAAGWRFGPRLALQAGFDLNIPKSSMQTYSGYQGTSYYEDTIAFDWTQRALDLSAVFRPDPDQGLFLFGGLTWAWVEVSATAFEGWEYEDGFGNTVQSGELVEDGGDFSTTGWHLGAGWDRPMANGRGALFASLKFTSLRVEGPLLGIDAFDVDAGGVSLAAGVRWFPFGD